MSIIARLRRLWRSRTQPTSRNEDPFAMPFGAPVRGSQQPSPAAAATVGGYELAAAAARPEDPAAAGARRAGAAHPDVLRLLQLLAEPSAAAAPLGGEPARPAAAPVTHLPTHVAPTFTAAAQTAHSSDTETTPTADLEETLTIHAEPAVTIGAQAARTRSAETNRAVDAGADFAIDTDRVQAIDALAASLSAAGLARETIDPLRRACQKRPDAHVLSLRLATTLYEAEQRSEALALLNQLAQQTSVAAQAHFMLGEHHGREQEPGQALEHYEAVLALDFGFPRARARVERLKAELDRPIAEAAPTILGAEDAGPGSRFVLRRELGRGGSGTVYLATDQTLGRDVALKVLHPQFAKEPLPRAQLFGEARLAASLNHPRVVTVYDLDEALNLVVMEYCRGGSLAEWLTHGPLPCARALAVTLGMGRVLTFIHGLGLVHRDLKPANLLFRKDPHDASQPIVLSDFGIARLAAATRQADSAGEGSVLYMSPEQRAGTASTPEQDLYACGLVLIEMLLGHPPLTSQQALQGTALADLCEPWRELEDVLPACVRTPLVALCRKLVEPDPRRRLASAVELVTHASSLEARLTEHDAASAAMRKLAALHPPPRAQAIAEWLAQEQHRVDGD